MTEVYLQVLEELGSRWAAVAVATSVHVLACSPLVNFGTEEQKHEWLPRMLDGELIGGYSLSEPHAGSDAAALTCKAERTTTDDGHDGYRITGTKAWITHGGRADFYSLFARTGPGSQGVSCFLAPGHTQGLEFGKPESKMGLLDHADHQRVLGRGRHRRRPSHRGRGPGPADRLQRARRRQARDRGRRHRARPVGARCGTRSVRSALFSPSLYSVSSWP